MELLEVHFHIRSIVGIYKDWRREERERGKSGLVFGDVCREFWGFVMVFPENSNVLLLM